MAFSKNPAMPSRDINELYDYVKWCYLELERLCKLQEITIFAVNTYRTPKYQDSIYAIGRTIRLN